MAALIELQHKNTTNISTSKYHNQESWQVSTWAHRAWFAGGCATVLISLAKTLFLIINNSRPWVDSMFAAFIGYVMADLATGIYHWAIDNYGSAKTSIFGSQIEAFQGHHQQPWAITTRQLANNLYIPAVAVTTAVTPINLLLNDPVLLGFVGVFAGCVMFSQLFHAWAHTPKRKLPAAVVALQDARIIVGRVQHAAHHRPPYNSNYCIVSGVWNRFLDKSKFFVALEVLFAAAIGARPRSWNDPNSDWAPYSGIH
ncbi:Ubiquitin-conjugating enzyme [Handroanthus impetiginosus]|uniref:Ubiquitin-conjugating enzyme n=1 Tax=Handroanthus impetiginosus TaxID=429701 RepID=A0A2G9G0B8_9LAMI|nr:Ubiquitin-conjugating enzyme [Handroanthus impetiginosus]